MADATTDINKITDLFKEFDKDGDNTISKDELTAALQKVNADLFTRENIDKLFETFDGNSDGRLNFGEFVAWIFSGKNDAKAAISKDPHYVWEVSLDHGWVPLNLELQHKLDGIWKKLRHTRFSGNDGESDSFVSEQGRYTYQYTLTAAKLLFEDGKDPDFPNPTGCDPVKLTQQNLQTKKERPLRCWYVHECPFCGATDSIFWNDSDLGDIRDYYGNIYKKELRGPCLECKKGFESVDFLMNCSSCNSKRCVASDTISVDLNTLCLKCGYDSRDEDPYGGCFVGTAEVEMASGEYKTVQSLTKGDQVWTPSGASIVLCKVLKPCKLAYMNLVSFGRVPVVTLGHPVRWQGKWCAAGAVGKPLQLRTKAGDHLYNFVLSAGHIIRVNGVECVTLGHGFQEEGVAHWYYGEKVLEDLRAQPSWVNGVAMMSRCTCVEDSRDSGEKRQISETLSLSSRAVQLDASLLLHLHLAAMQESGVPSSFRTGAVFLTEGTHCPPESSAVPDLVESFCARTNAMLQEQVDPFLAGAFCLWWVNSVHPFQDGNGRVARSLCFLVIAFLHVQHGDTNLNCCFDWHAPFHERRVRKLYFEGLQEANEICGFCDCCALDPCGSHTSVELGLRSLTGLLREIVLKGSTKGAMMKIVGTEQRCDNSQYVVCCH